MNEVAKMERQEVAHAAPAPDPWASMIEKVVMQPDLPMERVQAMFDLRERQMAKEAEQAFNAAFADAMAEMPDVRRTGHNKHMGTHYSTLDDLIRATRPVLSRYGLSLNWQTALDGDSITVTAIVRHAQGHSISTTLTGPRDNGKQMNALQGGGSTETYLKRYTGFSILGLSSGDERDDDGSAALGKQAITEGQYKELREKIDATGADEAKLLAFFKVENLVDLPQAKFGPAIAMLERKAKK